MKRRLGRMGGRVLGRKRRYRARMLGGVGLLALALGGCSGKPGSTGSHPSPSPTNRQTTDPTDPLTPSTPDWSLSPPKREAPPEVENSNWPKNPIDQFVLQKLKDAGLEPAVEATPSRLVRRLALDLTGLPPTPEDVQAFSADPSDAAYGELVDRLLDQPAFGEQRAHYWLDVARYADTHGYHFDNYRSVWPYRDYVIQSFAANKPFDLFTIEQLAGDLL